MPEYIAIEGILACGKTTLAQKLAERLGSHCLLEETEAHPFIAEFYRDPLAYTFETELGFALIHYHQLRRAEKQGTFSGSVVADFVITKDRLFAEMNLEGKQLRLFKGVFSYLSKRVPTPSAVIYLRASLPFIMGRIKKRGREMEMEVPAAYLRSLSDEYERFFAAKHKYPVLVLDAERYDFIRRPKDVESVVERLRQLRRGAGARS
jgi:deoxyguanosine kinase